jgi:hypothetical protein
MRKLVLTVSIFPLLLLNGCGQSVVGKYQCHGLPNMAALELRADGTAVQSGSMLGHPILGTGAYTADGGQVTVKSDVKIFGRTDSDANVVQDERKDETTFQKQGNGDLISELTTCKKI